MLSKLLSGCIGFIVVQAATNTVGLFGIGNPVLEMISILGIAICYFLIVVAWVVKTGA